MCDLRAADKYAIPALPALAAAEIAHWVDSLQSTPQTALKCCTYLGMLDGLRGLEIVAAQCAKKIGQHWGVVKGSDEWAAVQGNPAVVNLVVGGLANALNGATPV